jgi:HK97 family phage major capsid protein
MMSDRIAGVAELLSEVKELRDQLATAETERLAKIAACASKAELQKLAEDMARKSAELAKAVDQISLRLNRPGGVGGGDTSAVTLRQSARELLELRHVNRIPKSSPDDLPFCPGEAELEEAEHAVRGIKHLLKTTSIDTLPVIERKALTAFSMGASGFILVPEMSNRILSCLTDVTDLTGLAGQISISAGSIKFMVDNVRIMQAGWACDATCFANNPTPTLTEGLGEMEIKAETLRFIVCASRDILEDASVNVEQWMFNKVSWAFRNTISDAILIGDGIGKPQGLLHPSSGIPVCDVGPNTPAGVITWQDLVSVKWQVPIQWHAGTGGTAGGVYLLNQRTFGQILTMSDALGRPIMIASPVNPGEYIINGSPVRIATQMPDVMPGSTPILFGNLQAAYLLVTRKVVSMLQDPFSAGYCILARSPCSRPGKAAAKAGLPLP